MARTRKAAAAKVKPAAKARKAATPKAPTAEERLAALEEDVRGIKQAVGYRQWEH